MAKNSQSLGPDFSPEVVDDLYRYQPRSFPLTVFWAALFGIFGAHRFYCRKPWTGLLMMLSAGGALIWWIRDCFKLGELIEDCNRRERERLDQGLAPSSLNFLPPREQLDLEAPPKWHSLRAGRSRIAASAVLLVLIGLTLGTVSSSAELYEPIFILLTFIASSLITAHWREAARWPLASSVIRWTHRLRLYYHTVDPGNTWLLAMRPLIGPFLAPWQKKARAEVRLYLQFGVVMTLLFGVFQIFELLGSGGFWNGIALLLSEFIQTLVYTYLFVAPAGALLTTQLLLTDRDYVVWALSGVLIASVYYGVVFSS
ncbi:MAG: TM2 domain-containing protein [Pseudomonadota bacterium]